MGLVSVQFIVAVQSVLMNADDVSASDLEELSSLSF